MPFCGFVGTGGCLGDPELSTCIDFPLPGTPGSIDDGECAEKSSCQVYCEAMVERCQGYGDGSDRTFDSVERCINDCANEPVAGQSDGTFGEDTGNTLACRQTQLLQGSGDAVCQEASLINTGICLGVPCDAYCTVMVEACVDAYPSFDNCMTACGLLPRAATDTDANSVECRNKYALQAQAEFSVEACNAASFASDGTCGEPCETYCQQVQNHCQGDFQVYASEQACLDVCAFMNDAGNFNDWTFPPPADRPFREFDSVQCRSYHAGPPALLGPDLHCNHTRFYNAEHCALEDPLAVDWPCIPFCNGVLANCPGVYDDFDQCRQDCATFPEVTDPNLDPKVGPALWPVSTQICPT